MHTKLSVIFSFIFAILLTLTQADEFKPPTIKGTYKYQVNAPKENQEYTKEITFDYTFEEQRPNEIFLLDIYLLTGEDKIYTFLEKADTSPANHRLTQNFPETLSSGDYTVRYNETKNTGIYWSTAFYVTDIPIKYKK
ncbi:5491_t:CDS:2 [Ambispora gerdemannii]|uniref:5491_t:CDS:1 n=1 Tax=Ambispora gerdemannii TaxID=144530 RepID=A0A9N9GGN5_9GLOM|nr:5491_t:CDS:2 [Ambispora gerdemannii]